MIKQNILIPLHWLKIRTDSQVALVNGLQTQDPLLNEKML